MERTLILLKPDAVQRGLVGAVISRFESKGLKLAAMKMMTITPELAAPHYEAHKAAAGAPRGLSGVPQVAGFAALSPCFGRHIRTTTLVGRCRLLVTD